MTGYSKKQYKYVIFYNMPSLHLPYFYSNDIFI